MRGKGTSFYFSSLSFLTELIGLSVCRPDNTETLLSLSVKMSKYQQQLKDATETLKVRQSAAA